MQHDSKSYVTDWPINDHLGTFSKYSGKLQNSFTGLLILTGAELELSFDVSQEIRSVERGICPVAELYLLPSLVNFLQPLLVPNKTSRHILSFGTRGIVAHMTMGLTHKCGFLPRDARYCYRKSSVRPSVCLSVCLSVRPSVTLRYRWHIGWTSSKLITRIISLGSLILSATTSAI